MKKQIYSFIIVIGIVTLFVACLNAYSLKEKLNEFTAQNNEVVLNVLKNKLEYIAGYGKDLKKYFGIGKVSDEFKNSCSTCDDIVLADEDGEIIYSTVKDMSTVSTILGKLNDQKGEDELYKSIFSNGMFASSTDVRDADVAVSAVIYSLSQNERSSAVINGYQRILLLIYVVGIIVMACVVGILYVIIKGNLMNSKVVVIIFTLFLVGTSVATFKYYEESVREYIYYCVDDMISIVDEDFSKLSLNGVDIKDVGNVEEYLADICTKIDALDKIEIESENQGMKTEYKFNYNISTEYMKDLLKNNLTDVFMIFIVAVFLHIEITSILKISVQESSAKAQLEPSGVRAQAFFMFLSYNLSSFYVPLRMVEILKTSGVSSMVMTSMPTSLEVLSISVTAIISGALIDKKGWKNVYIAGNVLLILGMMMSFVGMDPIIFIVSRVVCGLGYGACLTCIRTCAVYCGEKNIGSAIASINTAAYACVNIGSVAGGFIGQFMGIKYAFVISAVVGVAGYIFCEYKMLDIRSEGVEEYSLAKKALEIVKNKKLMFSAVAILLPISFSSSFIDYFYPVYSSATLGFKLTEISRGYLLNGLIIVFLGVGISNLLQKHLKIKGRMILSSMILAVSYALFAMRPDRGGIYVSIAVLSIAMTYSVGTFIEYYLSFESVKSLGFAKSMSLFTLFEKMGAYIAVLLYGVILAGNVVINIVAVGGVLFLIMFIYSLFFLKERNKNGNYIK